MNIVDWIIIGIIGISILFGLYRGFIASVASLLATLICWGGSYLLTPTAVDIIDNNTRLRESLTESIDISKLIGDADKTLAEIANNQAARDEFLKQVPKPLDNLLDNMIQSAGDTTGSAVKYLKDHLVDAVMKVIGFLVCFVVLMLVTHLVIILLKTVFKFPVLKQMNTTAGGIFGLLRGILICFVLFAAVPMVQAILATNTSDMINELVDGSKLAPIFNNNNLLNSVSNIKV